MLHPRRLASSGTVTSRDESIKFFLATRRLKELTQSCRRQCHVKRPAALPAGSVRATALRVQDLARRRAQLLEQLFAEEDRFYFLTSHAMLDSTNTMR